ncbi:MAG: hypothetical protein JXN63_02380 [Candidatus Delongbacteria bacterium]|nr:hypothetical protein [Candidatus Delongbacteria bacterium]
MTILEKILKKDTYYQSDNRGIYQDSVAKATVFWFKRNKLHKFDPFLLYSFEDEADAVRSLLDLEIIKIAQDTEELICTKPLVYGYYPAENGGYEVLLCGRTIDRELFRKAESSFKHYNGKKINDKEPETKKKHSVIPETVPEKPQKSYPDPEFVEEKQVVKNEKNMTCRVYKAQSSGEAIAFLQKKLITRDSLVLIVKTPSGGYGRNYNGIYKIKK